MEDPRLAKIFLANMLRHHKSVLDWARNIHFRSSRNWHEARVLAQGIDRLLEEGISHSSAAMEIFIRRLVGLQKADQYDDVTLLEELEWAPPEDVVPREVLRAALKGAERRKKLRPQNRKWNSSGGPAPPPASSKSSPPGMKSDRKEGKRSTPGGRG